VIFNSETVKDLEMLGFFPRGLAEVLATFGDSVLVLFCVSVTFIGEFTVISA
jgi:hypothetical protein